MQNPIVPDQQHTLILGGRLSYCDAFKARGFQGDNGETTGTPKFKTNILIPREKTLIGGVEMGGPAVIKAVKKALGEAKADHWGGKADSISLPQSDVCFRNGDARDEDGVPLGKWVKPETEGHYVFSASEKDAPTTLDRRRRPISESDGLIYSGAYALVVVKLWVQDNKWGKRINANLKSIQFVAHGDKFGDGGTDGSEFLPSLDDDDDDGFAPDLDADDNDDMNF